MLIPDKVEPVFIRPVEFTAVTLFLVASNLGVSALPVQVIIEVKYGSDYIKKPNTSKGMRHKLYAAAPKR